MIIYLAQSRSERPLRSGIIWNLDQCITIHFGSGKRIQEIPDHSQPYSEPLPPIHFIQFKIGFHSELNSVPWITCLWFDKFYSKQINKKYWCCDVDINYCLTIVDTILMFQSFSFDDMYRWNQTSKLTTYGLLNIHILFETPKNSANQIFILRINYYKIRRLV